MPSSAIFERDLGNFSIREVSGSFMVMWRRGKTSRTVRDPVTGQRAEKMI